MMHNSEDLYIDTPQALAELVEALAGESWLALDTEFLRERTYYAQLCLIQVATPNLVACVDPLRLPNLAPLLGVIHDQAKTKVLHSAHQDLEIFYYLSGSVPAPIFDTQLAAALLGFAEQIGYAALVEDLLGVNLDKTHARTDWSRRPLSAEQIRYAADDVRFLAQIYPMLVEKLDAKQRRDWLSDDFTALSSPQRYETPAPEAWRRVSGASQLKAHQRAVLKMLAAWREQTAQQRNKPRRWIVADDALLELARRTPKSVADLEKLRSLPPDAARKYGPELVEHIAAGQALPQDQWPSSPPKLRLTQAQEAVVDAAMALLKTCALEQGVSPPSLASRRDVERIVAGERDHPLLQGWRRAVAGRQLLALLEGNVGLVVEQGSVMLIDKAETDVSG